MFGGNPKENAYCKITSYVQIHCRDLYQVLERFCLFSIFTPEDRNEGIIFLMPDESQVKKIVELSNKDGMKSIEMIKSCVLYGYATSCKDLENKKYPSKANRFVEFDKSCGTNGGGKVTEAKHKFHPLRDGERLAIFGLSGPIPTDGEPAPHRDHGGKGKGARGGRRHPRAYGRIRDAAVRSRYLGGNDADIGGSNKGGDEKDIESIWGILQSHMKTFVTHGQLNSSSGHFDPWLIAILSVYHWLKSKGKNGKAELIAKTYSGQIGVIHVLNMLTPEERTEWCQANQQFDNKKLFDELLSNGMDEEYYKKKVDFVNAEFAHGAEKPNVADIVQRISGLHEKMVRHLNLSAEAKSALAQTYGSEKQFVCMWMSLSELGFLLTPRLDLAIRAGADGRKDINWIGEKLHNYYVKQLTAPASRAKFNNLLICNEVAHANAGVAYLCSGIQFMVNAMCAGAGGGVEVHDALDFKSPHDVLPNNLAPTGSHLGGAYKTAMGEY